MSEFEKKISKIEMIKLLVKKIDEFDDDDYNSLLAAADEALKIFSAYYDFEPQLPEEIIKAMGDGLVSLAGRIAFSDPSHDSLKPYMKYFDLFRKNRWLGTISEILLLFNLGTCYSNSGDYQRSIKFYQSSLKLLTPALDDERPQIRCNITLNLAIAFSYMRMSKESNNLLHSTEEIFASLTNPYLYYINLMQQFHNYKANEDYLNCIRLIAKLEAFLKLQPQKERLEEFYLSCANLYLLPNIFLPERAKHYLEQTRILLRKNTYNPSYDRYIKHQYGYTSYSYYIAINDYAAAEKAIKQNIQLSTGNNNKVHCFSDYCNLGRVLFKKNDLKQARIAWKHAAEYAEQNKIAKDLITIKINIGKLEKAEGNIAKSKEILESALKDINKLNLNEEFELLYDELADIYISENKWEKACKLNSKVIQNLHGKYDKINQDAFSDLEYSLRDSYLHIEKLKQDNKKLKAEHQRPPIDFIGQNPSIIDIKEKIKIAADNPEINVLILGESGSGKGVIARLIHNQSLRKDKHIIELNCAGIPEYLAESLIFGHKKGAFTGADKDHVGYLQDADGSTLFLDEIGDMPLNLQIKLLKALEEKQFTPLGSHQSITSDFRLITATNRDISKLIGENIFRFDLYSRINQMVISIPPLRQRIDDLPMLIEHFCKYYYKSTNYFNPHIKDVLLKYLQKYDFPGNVRELMNIIERVMIFTKAGKERLFNLSY